MARVAVFCSSATGIDARYLELAWRLGEAIAARGHDLVSGGGRVSMMGAVAAAVREGGGHTLGVIPQALVGREVADTGADELEVTPDMRTRKARMDEAADAFIVLPGGLGTLEELLEIWVARYLGLHTKPVVLLDPDGVFAELHALVRRLVAEQFVAPSSAAVLARADGVDQALDAVEQEWARSPGPVPAPAEQELLEADP